MADVLLPVGDGTQRVIDADAIRALMGYLADGPPEGYRTPQAQPWVLPAGPAPDEGGERDG